MDIVIIHKDFDLDRYEAQIKDTINRSMDRTTKVRRLKLMVQRAYEQGITEGKKSSDWYEKSLKENYERNK